MSLTLKRTYNVLPGFTPALGFTIFYLGLIVLIPLAATFLKTTELTWPEFWRNGGSSQGAGFM
jgi:sulfate transport system permease protein